MHGEGVALAALTARSLLAVVGRKCTNKALKAMLGSTDTTNMHANMKQVAFSTWAIAWYSLM